MMLKEFNYFPSNAWVNVIITISADEEYVSVNCSPENHKLWLEKNNVKSDESYMAWFRRRPISWESIAGSRFIPEQYRQQIVWKINEFTQGWVRIGYMGAPDPS